MDEAVYQQLLETLTASGSGNGPTMEDLLSQLGDTDPRVRLIAQYMAAQRQAAEEEALPDDDEYSEPSHSRIRPNKAELRHRKSKQGRLREMLENMYQELEELRERNDTLAAALGACYLCWGDDPDCEVCQGKGHPGSSVPDRALFSRLVVPAVRRLQTQKRGDSRFSRDAQPDTFSQEMNPNDNERKEK